MISGWLGLAAAALSTATTVNELPCLTDEEALALVITALPDAVISARTRCSPTLPQTSLLTQAGAIVAARWRHDAARVTHDADRAIDKISRLPISSLIGTGGTRQVIQPIISREIGKQLSLGDCDRASETIDALSPLPARNVARILIALAPGRIESRMLPFSLCKKPNR